MPTTIPGNLIFQSPTNNDPLLDLNTQPSLDLQFVASKTLDDRVSGLPLVDHQRDVSSGKSAGTYVGSDGLIKTSKVNFLTYSDYSVVETTTDAQLEGLATAPDGTNTARRYSTPSAGLDAINKVYTAGTAGKDYTFSVWVRSTGTASEVRLIVGDTQSIANVQISTEWQRFSITKTNNASNLVRAYVQMLNVGDEVEVWGAQLEEGSTATPYIKTTNLPSAAPRFDHDPVTGESLGLLVEESRTNLITRSTATGATNGVIGSGGALPSGWYIDQVQSGTTVEIIGSGTEKGLTYVDIRFSGTTNALNRTLIRPGSPIPINGETYYLTAYSKLVSGTNNLNYTRFDTGALSLTSEFKRNTGATRSGFTGTFFPRFDIGLDAIGQSYDITIRFAAPQMELGSFPTSYIPTTSSAVTRAADVAEITGSNFSSWYNQSEGSFYYEGTAIDTSLNGNRFISGTHPRAFISAGSTENNQVGSWDGTYSVGLTGGVTTWQDGTKAAVAWSSPTRSITISGLTPYSSVSNQHNVAETQIRINQSTNGTSITNGYVKRLTYYPYRLPDATLQEITS